MKKIIIAVLILLAATSIIFYDFFEVYINEMFEETCDHSYPSYSPYQCTRCGDFNEEKCAPVYKRLQNAAGDWSDVAAFLADAEYCTQTLPLFYKDVARYKELLELWLEIRTKYTEEGMRLALRDDDWPELVDFKKLRDVYLTLAEEKNTLTWDFKAYADMLLDTNLTGDLLTAFAIGKWKDSNGYFFGFHESDKNTIIFSSNLPFYDYDDSTSYSVESRNVYLTINKLKVPAYRVLNITRDTITIFCFDNSQTYTLTKFDEGYKEIPFFILNTSTKKWHLPTCHHLPSVSNEKRVFVSDYYKGLYPGYTACQHCKPR